MLNASLAKACSNLQIIVEYNKMYYSFLFYTDALKNNPKHLENLFKKYAKRSQKNYCNW